MVCEKCKIQPATVHFQHIINGEKIESYLCQNCANEAEQGISFGSLFQGLMEAVFKSAAKTGGGVSSAAQETATKCPVCGFTYNDFKKTGKLGCCSCYNAFRKELGQILKNIQGSSSHEGKFPRRSGAAMMHKKAVENLRLSLQKAIQNEEYEKAASLRDQIREMEDADGKVV